MSEKITRFPEQSADTSSSEKIVPFSEFNKEAAEANVKAAKAELENNKEVAEFVQEVEKAKRYEERVNKAMELNASPATLERFAKKHREALNAAKKINDRSVNDPHFSKFIEKNECPVFSKAA